MHPVCLKILRRHVQALLARPTSPPQRMLLLAHRVYYQFYMRQLCSKKHFQATRLDSRRSMNWSVSPKTRRPVQTCFWRQSFVLVVLEGWFVQTIWGVEIKSYIGESHPWERTTYIVYCSHQVRRSDVHQGMTEFLHQRP
jgi:hypothetical protein